MDNAQCLKLVQSFETYLQTVESIRPYDGRLDDLESAVKACRRKVDTGAGAGDDELFGFVLVAWSVWRELREDVARLVAIYG